MSVGARITVQGLSELRRGLRAANANAPRLVQVANKKVAQTVAEKAEQRYARRYRSRSGRGATSIRALASQSRAQVALGGARAPYLPGQNFGSFGRYPQFVPKATPDRFLYRTIADERQRIEREYLDVVADVLREAFPHG